ncbi:glycosyl transferase group 1 [Candidatus Accumulibacter phosphatis]|uniref:Glycosyl transferase group 1 n=1 Tax=Accumulibacter regalis TaxID=522306 RepID=C7RNQ8_ACCRE
MVSSCINCEHCIGEKCQLDWEIGQMGKVGIVLFGPSLDAVSGVSSHVKLLMASSLADRYKLMHFQVGREGRAENKWQRMARFAFSPLQLAVFLVRKKPRIVHINTSMDRKAFWRDLTYLIVARLLGCRVVNQFHSGSAPQSLFSSPLLSSILKRFLLASHVVTVLSSGAVRSHRAFDSRIAVELVPNAIDTKGLLDVERERPVGGAPLRLVFVGRIIRSKGLFESLAALKLLKDQGLGFELRVAGSGPDEAEVLESIARLGLTSEVTLLGPVFGAEKDRLWLGSDVQVFPTYHNEGLPYSILESMAAGCVPITCPVAAIPDVMRDGVHGLFVPAHDPAAVAAAIRRLADNRAELLCMSAAGRQRIAENYTVDRLAARFGEIYERVA